MGSRSGDEAEPIALDKMRKFMEDEDVVAASAWLMISQAISELQKFGSEGETIH
jgi:hypothetical protein